MIIQINASHDVRVVSTAEDEIVVVTYETLLPYLPGIVQLHGLGHVTGHTVELEENWPGWPPDSTIGPRAAKIVTKPGALR
ncbi:MULTISPECIES: hypothetical protein [Williamsia]|uniref:Uncharacterized protein n=1 Tax=Williamsia limnetica TaxID=882452 RepID=A0A318R7X8_WILLI|nr:MULTISPECIES: hypothetical protein [Williamsia]ORM36188.1 hypothetical protein BFL43_07585 [Williamsia sp. 1135]PYE11680.1 hypothetical protein DFR67_13514 [Williamsia limnetica]